MFIAATEQDDVAYWSSMVQAVTTASTKVVSNCRARKVAEYELIALKVL